jgi:hypothetical protein
LPGNIKKIIVRVSETKNDYAEASVNL